MTATVANSDDLPRDGFCCRDKVNGIVKFMTVKRAGDNRHHQSDQSERSGNRDKNKRRAVTRFLAETGEYRAGQDGKRNIEWHNVVKLFYLCRLEDKKRHRAPKQYEQKGPQPGVS